MQTKIVICGDRHWSDWEAIRHVLDKMKAPARMAGMPIHVDPMDTTIITGGATGADNLTNRLADIMGFQTHIENAEWSKYGNRAGPIRNRKMLDMKPDFVIAFHDNIGDSKGTKDCVKEAFKRGIPVYIYTHEHGLQRLEYCSF